MIRPATAADYEAVLALSRELGNDDPDPPRDRWIAHQLPTTLVYERDGSAIGYLHYITLAEIGHVRHVRVAAAARRTGAGRALMLAAADELRRRHFPAWELNVKETNTAAIALYESLGLRPAYRAAWMRFEWAHVDRLPVDAAGTAPIAPDEDAAIEQQFGIARGRIAQSRERDDRIIQLRDASGCAGVACFDPAFPGAYVFATARPSLARALLETLQPHARHAHLGMIVAHDAALEAVLVGAGGTVRFHVRHYQGRL